MYIVIPLKSHANRETNGSHEINALKTNSAKRYYYYHCKRKCIHNFKLYPLSFSLPFCLSLCIHVISDYNFYDNSLLDFVSFSACTRIWLAVFSLLLFDVALLTIARLNAMLIYGCQISAILNHFQLCMVKRKVVLSMFCLLEISYYSSCQCRHYS